MKAFDGDVIAACRLTTDTITEILHPNKRKRTQRDVGEQQRSVDMEESPKSGGLRT